jgi:hypothetical protein
MSSQEHIHRNIPCRDLGEIECGYSIIAQTSDARIPVYFIHDSNSMCLSLPLDMMGDQIRASSESGGLAITGFFPYRIVLWGRLSR